MAATLLYFCELVEGEENKLTTFSTWTIMLGCNESNIIFHTTYCHFKKVLLIQHPKCYKYYYRHHPIIPEGLPRQSHSNIYTSGLWCVVARYYY